MLGVRLANRINFKPNISQRLMRKNVSTIEDEGWLTHHLVQLRVIIGSELVPLGHHRDGMSTGGGGQSRRTGGHEGFEVGDSLGGDV